MVKTEAIVLGNYQATELIHQGEHTLVYRGENLEHGQPVAIKLMGNQFPSFRELVQFRNEYAISKNLEIDGVIQTYALERYENRYALIMEDIGGVSLAEYEERQSLSLLQFLDIAIQLSDILHQLHNNSIIHKDIKPANILIVPQTQKVKLIDFSIATVLSKETQVVQTPNILEGTLAYLSPEQTGRMNRGIDYRSDFYALGVTFYELLTGALPFTSNDALELIHAHIARSPEPIEFLIVLGGDSCPPMLSKIVMKLMAKNAEDRYHSALGLKYDLEKCRDGYREYGRIEGFPLGERDICDRFLIPEKLYGREREIQQLLAAFDRVAAGDREMMLVSGFSGIGKTAVVNEIHKPITRQKGYFIKGKYDQFNRNIPFSAIVQSFRKLMAQLLSESALHLARWKEEILAAVGENGRVLSEVIPELKEVIGEQPAVVELSGSAAQNRFNLLLQKIIAVFATAEHPLVIFLDDLQWADSASLHLIKMLVEDSDTEYLLLLGAYRDNEVFPAHPLMTILDELQKKQASVSTIALDVLPIHHVNRLVAETLSCTEDIARSLTELVYQKTKGNPFFTTQFLKGLHEDNLIVFNANLGYWECDLVQVTDASLTDDVVEFMTARLQKLPGKTQEILKLAAFIGNQFDLDTLAIVCDAAIEDVAIHLWSALKEGAILPITEAYKFFQDAITSSLTEPEQISYRFLHDRVQQAAYQLESDRSQARMHYQIGQRLLNHLNSIERDRKLLDIVNHFNQAISLIRDPQEQQNLIELNLKAGAKAKTALAYQAAMAYYNTARILLADRSWETHYSTYLKVYSESVETAFLCGKFDEMEEWSDAVFQHAKTFLDRIKVYEMKVQAAIAQNQLQDAIQLGLDFLQHLEITLPQPVTDTEIDAAFAENDRLLKTIAIEDIVHFPMMSDRHKEAAVRMITISGLAMYIANPELLMLAVAKQVNLCLRYGNTSTSADAYATYGLFLCGERGEISQGYRFGQLAVNVLETLQTVEIKSLVYVLFNGFIKHWQDPCRETLSDLQKAYHWGLEFGDLQNAALSAYCYCSHQFLCGINLEDLHQDLKQYARGVESIQQLGIKGWLDPLIGLTRKLLELSSEPLLLLSSITAEEHALEAYKQDSDRTGIFLFAFSKMLLSYLWDRGDVARRYANIAREHLDGITGMAWVPYFYFYDTALLLSVDLSSLSEEETARLHNNQRKLQDFCQYNPGNLQHKCQLLRAESFRRSGDRLLAIELYDTAIAGAKTNGYLQEEALGNELAAKFYLDWGKETIAEAYLQKAYYAYAQWGAKAKVKDLENRYPQYLSSILQPNRTASSSGVRITKITSYSQAKTLTTIASIFDFASILKASQTLSGEIELQQLLSILMTVILENAGATKGALLLIGDRGLTIEAIATRREEKEEFVLESLNESIPLDRSQNLPRGIINYVRNTTKIALLDAKKAQEQFAGDRYLFCFSPQSLLCMPLLVRGQSIGILYLENGLTADAFTRDRIEVLDTLCAQAAISIENARLYQQAQQALENLQEAQLQLVQHEKMAVLGNLVAGVAHEINNPVGFISGNISAAREYLDDVLDLLTLYQTKYPHPDPEITAELVNRDLEFIREDFPKLIESMQTGCDRIGNISTSLRTFSRTDTTSKTEFNLHEGIDSTLLILKYRLKANETRPAIEIIKNYGKIPLVQCYAGQINQVFMNLLANAIDALEESNGGKSFAQIERSPNRITITTKLSGDRQNVVVKIADNGIGMAADVKEKLFEQGFTTKGVGKGTGLGMAIARQIIEEKHGGAIACHSEPSKGTEFAILLPFSY
ncbi:trifunctional serine/threonine-protein kinase/ATP-binding protein/sensor histidine kinase [Roseofilum casamattae]|uniref:histidine kinase n=1 Tax=Roseofilum casamattae BLCC-M143 TaxID=3022442 RepID=A0ABT7BUV0_9CYAN|nr:ATP-binding sensor histidine kinase [Roseofilum casamattae]MDJ1182965.1 AAA family ATPase [Roseofilum casamattae BLCC-M143]